MSVPVLALTQGDPAGIGPEILLRALHFGSGGERPWRPLVLAERAALEAVRNHFPPVLWERLRFFSDLPDGEALAALPATAVPVVDPVDRPRKVTPGHPGRADAVGALAALDQGITAVRSGLAEALVTGPLSKGMVARHAIADFRGHTEYLADVCGLECYGCDHLVAFVTPDLKVALLSTHLSLADAVANVRREVLLRAIRCLVEHVRPGSRIAVAGLNPHAGEGGLIGREEIDEIQPALEDARREGLDVHGPASPDSVFVRARRGEFDWVLALYHDQGLVAVKTASLNTSTQVTLGLPFLRVSVDHGTAYGIAGRGIADATALRTAVRTALDLLAERRDG